MTTSLISIILPVHNQADHLGPLVEDYMVALKKLPCDYELILVANACRDNTYEICQSLSRQFACVRSLEISKGGWGLAVKLGLSVRALTRVIRVARTIADLEGVPGVEARHLAEALHFRSTDR